MAKALAEFTQGTRPNPTTDVMKISQSDSDPTSIYIQLVKKGTRFDVGTGKTKDKMMHFKIDGDDIDDIVTVLLYAKKVIVGG